jgi:predicted PurR-regulated permease PerM
MTAHRPDLARTTLGVLSIGLLILAILWVLHPFIGPVVWAATIVVATWPLMRRIESWLGGRRAPAVAVMTLGMLMLFVVPVTLGVATIAQHVDDIADLASRLTAMRLPSPPNGLAELPLVGAKLHEAWDSAVASGGRGMLQRLIPYAGPALAWLVREIGSIGLLLAQSIVVVVLAAVMYSRGEFAASGLSAVVHRLAGVQGVAALMLAGQAVRGVALGVGLVAVAQAALGGISLAIADVPYAAGLTVIMFVLSIAQVGPLPVLLPAAGWLFWSDATEWGAALLVVAVASSVLDSVLRPMLIRMGADLPLLLVFAGVVGGMLAFGLVGIFIGPVVLAVGFTLMKAWVAGEPAISEARGDERSATE